MTDNTGDWTAQGFRQTIRGKIEEAIRQSGNPTTKSVIEMENHVFQKARSKEEYLGYVARLIIHVREMNSKKPAIPAGQGTTVTLAPGAAPSNPGVQVSDPMSALRNLAGQGTTAAITVQQTGQPQLGAPVLGTNTMPVVSQSQVQAMSQGGIVTSAPAPNVMAASLGQPGVAPIMMQQGRFIGPVGSLVTNQPQRLQLSHNVQLIHRNRHPQPQPQPPAPGVPNQSVPMQQLMGVLNDNLSFVQNQQQSPATSQYQTSTQFQGQSPGPVGTNQGPGSNQSTVPSPAPPHGTNVSSSQLAPSPAGYAPSPTSQITPSPVGYSGRAPGTAGAPSPGSALNTPGNIGTSPSPAGGRAPQDDQLYLEKLKQLSKYIEPLRRMIARIDKDEDRKKELSRMKNLLDILSDTNKRCSMEILLKCEQVLERLEFRGSGGELSAPSASQSAVGPSKAPEQNICQPLLEAITYHIKSLLFNHTLQRTFGPAVAALNGPKTVVPTLPVRKRKREEDHGEISNVLQGEIARLDQRFKVQLDPVQHPCSRTVHLICQLDDRNLPCVPPITIAVPENYPEKPPQCNTSKEEYESTPFLQTIQKILTCRMNSMPTKFSITSLLDAWEMSVRQACAPKSSATKI